MAATDTRVVQLRFENEQFERNIAKSQKSIEDLKEAMDFEETSRGLEKLSGAFDFSSIENNIQKLTDKFTGFGNAAEYIVSRIRYTIESAAQSLENFIRSISTMQITVGQGKYDALNKAVMSIISGGKATEEQAYNIMDRAMKYTDQTSHDFSTMVNQIAALTSVGMGLEEAELLIEGIGNAATFAGKGAAEAASSMSLVSKSITSYVGWEKFSQLQQTMGVVTDKWREQALEAAAAVGTLRKENDKFYVNVKGQKKVLVTAQNLQDTLRYRWLTGEALKELYKNYQFANSGNLEQDLYDLAHPEKAVDSFGKTAYMTGQRALTLADAINAVKESVSSGWMQSFRIIFGDVTEASEHFTNLADRIVAITERISGFRNDLLTMLSAHGGREGFMDLIFGSFEKDVDDGTVGVMDILDGAISVISKGFWDLIKVLNPSIMLAGDFSDDKWEENASYRAQVISDMIIRLFDNVKEFFGNIKKFFTEDINVGGRVTSRLEMIHEVISGISGALGLAWAIGEKAVDFVANVLTDLDPSISAILDLFSKLGFAIFDTAQDTQKAGKIQKFFVDLRKTLEPVTTGINNVIGSLVRLVELIFGLDGKDKDRSGAFDSFGKILLTFADIVAKVLGPILNFFSKVIDAFLVFEGGFNKETFKEFGKRLSEGFKEMLKSFVDNLPESFKGLADWIRDLFGLWEEESQGNEKSFATFLRKLFTASFKNFDEFLSGLTSGFSLKRALETGFGFGSAFNYLNQIIGWFKGTNLYGVIMAFLGIATLGSLFKLLAKANHAVKTVGIFFDDVGGNMKGFFTNFKQGFLGDYEWFGERMLNISKSIALIAAAIAILGSMDRDRMIQGILGMTAIILLMTGFYVVMTKFTKATYTQQLIVESLIGLLAGSIVAIAISLSALALALIPLSLDPKRMITAVFGMAAMLAALGAFIVIMMKQLKVFTFGIKERDKWNHIGQLAAILFTVAITMAIISAAISALAVAMTPLAMTGWGGMARAIIAFGSILVLFGAFIVIMIKQLDTLAFTIGGANSWAGIGKMAVMMLTLATTLDLLAIGIGAIIVAITPFSVMSWGGFIRAIAGLGLIMTEIGLFIKALQALSMDDKSLSVRIAGLAAFAFSLGVLISALIPLALMNWGGWARALVGLGIVLAELIGYMKLVKMAHVKNVELIGFAAFAASIGILLFSLQPIAGMDWGGWARSMVGLGLVLAELVGFMLIIKRTDVHLGALYGFIGFAASLAILMYSLRFVAELTPDQYVRGIVGLGTVMLMIVVLLHILKEIQPDLKTAGSTLLLLIGLGAAMILFGIAFNEVKDVPWENIVAFAAGISALLVAVAFASTLASKGGIKGVLILAVGLAAILAVIALMAPMVISGVATGLAEAAGQLTLMATLMQSFTGKMGGIDEGVFDKAKRVVGQMGELLGMMLKFSLYGGSFVSFTKAVSQLTLVSGELKLLTNRVGDIDEPNFEKLADYVGQLKVLCEGPMSGFASHVQTAQYFSSVMYELGTGLEIFDNHVSSMALDPENNPAINTIQALAACANDLDIITKMNIDTLTSKISGLGGAMILYAEGAKAATGMEIDENTPDLTAAIALMRAITTGLAEGGGIVLPENMPTEEDLGLYGAQLAALAAALIKFEKAGKSLGSGTEQALSTLNFFQNLKERLDKTDFQNNLTALDAFGDSDEAAEKAGAISTFGKNIEQLGISLGQFANSTTYLDSATGEVKTFDYSNATKSLEKIRDVANTLPTFGGAIEVITGVKEDLTTFSGEIEALGQALNDFHMNTTSMDEANGKIIQFDYTNAVTALQSIADIPGKLPEEGGLIALFAGDPPSLTKLAGDIVGLGAGLELFSKSIVGDGSAEHPGFDPNCVDPAIKVVDSMTDFMLKLQKKLPNVGGLVKFFETLWSGRDMSLTDLGNQLGEMGEGLGKFGGQINGKFANAEQIKNMLDAVSSIIDMMVQLAAVADAGYYNDFAIYAEGLADFISRFSMAFTQVTDETGAEGTTVSSILSRFIDLMRQVSAEINRTGGDIDAESLNMFATMMKAESRPMQAHSTI